MESTASMLRAREGFSVISAMTSFLGKNISRLAAMAWAPAGKDLPLKTGTSPKGSPAPENMQDLLLAVEGHLENLDFPFGDDIESIGLVTV